MTSEQETKEQIQALRSLVQKTVEDWHKMLTEQTKASISIFDRAALSEAIGNTIGECLIEGS